MGEIQMTLSEEDATLFYELWLPLLAYVNKRYNVNKNLRRMAQAKSLDPKEVKEVANRLWDNVSVIDDYLSEQADMPEEHQKIISGWKRCIRGKFIMERHLKKGTIFISMENEKVYQVSGIVSSWEEMFCGAPLPIILEAVLIPFRDVIITDGLVVPYNILIGRTMAGEIKNVYLNAKKAGKVHRTLLLND